ncbi:class I SAM-dependent methyltransferase [Micromonospora coxensis]|uniref:Phosphatidylethanolamine N-methyltransferase /phosphatidyl-N-methylethanolamine N-methyltransferase n=1 Tax=Micromonospora coxensis TaxID=356852 RepID=A0A1C5GKJ0_9ACTN|nr:class I SAM-dependent methyltransferase [Micromonospora coxensis]SCG34262.1 phosphatidylethanolamine N-methyltransferase /phosphatidyl-N-methylethanolamine N-methyltransferase [Micromonospora coxensis]
MSADEKQRRVWDRHAAGYDRQMNLLERRFLRDTRAWIGRQATGDTLEVAVGTGRNLPYYAADVRLTGVDLSPRMLEIARRRAAELGREVDLRLGTAHRLEFPDASFDSVVCTLSLCAIPDDQRAVAEMIRVLRPGGLLLLADHVVGATRPIRAVQRLLELVSVPAAGEHFRRRPITHVAAAGLHIEKHERFARGVVERLAARRPA